MAMEKADRACRGLGRDTSTWSLRSQTVRSQMCRWLAMPGFSTNRPHPRKSNWTRPAHDLIRDEARESFGSGIRRECGRGTRGPQEATALRDSWASIDEGWRPAGNA